MNILSCDNVPVFTILPACTPGSGDPGGGGGGVIPQPTVANLFQTLSNGHYGLFLNATLELAPGIYSGSRYALAATPAPGTSQMLLLPNGHYGVI